MEPAHSETGDCRVEPPASILVARLSMSHLVSLLEFNQSDALFSSASVALDPLNPLEIAPRNSELGVRFFFVWHSHPNNHRRCRQALQNAGRGPMVVPVIRQSCSALA